MSLAKSQPKLRVNDDIEHRIQAVAAKDGIRIEEFFIDFDKLRKGTCGEAAVSTLAHNGYAVQNLYWNFGHHPDRAGG